MHGHNVGIFWIYTTGRHPLGPVPNLYTIVLLQAPHFTVPAKPPYLIGFALALAVPHVSPMPCLQFDSGEF